MAIKNNRIGLVRISTNLIKKNLEEVAEALKGSVILKAEWQEWTDQLVYVLWNADLPEIPFGASPPEYWVLYDSKLKRRLRFQPVSTEVSPEVEKLFL